MQNGKIQASRLFFFLFFWKIEKLMINIGLVGDKERRKKRNCNVSRTWFYTVARFRLQLCSPEKSMTNFFRDLYIAVKRRTEWKGINYPEKCPQPMYGAARFRLLAEVVPMKSMAETVRSEIYCLPWLLKGMNEELELRYGQDRYKTCSIRMCIPNIWDICMKIKIVFHSTTVFPGAL